MLTRALAAATAAASLLLASGAARATIWEFDWTDNAPNVGHSDSGGQWASMNGTFNDATNVLSWSVTFNNKVTQGLTLAVSDGPNPKGHPGQLGLLYIDATNTASPVVTAYAYNGQDTYLSYVDGNGNAGGNQTPDRIVSSEITPGFLLSASVVDTATTRTINFSIDASGINSHAPLYPHATDAWEGVRFDDKLGIWFHAFRNLTTAYGDSGAAQGFLTNWYRPDGKEGYFDGANLTTTVKVPTPGSGALALLGAAGLAGRRRKRAV